MTRYFRVQCCSSLMGFKCYLFHNKISKFFTKSKKCPKTHTISSKKKKKNVIFPLLLLQTEDLPSNFFGAVDPFNPTFLGSVQNSEAFFIEGKKISFENFKTNSQKVDQQMRKVFFINVTTGIFPT